MDSMGALAAGRSSAGASGAALLQVAVSSAAVQRSAAESRVAGSPAVARRFTEGAASAVARVASAVGAGSTVEAVPTDGDNLQGADFKLERPGGNARPFFLPPGVSRTLHLPDKMRLMKRIPARTLVAFPFAVALAAATAFPQTTSGRDPRLIDLDGYKRLVDQYRGKPLIVNFWATWCEPCREEYPLLVSLANEYSPKGLRVVGVSLDDDGEIILVRRFLKRYQPSFPNFRKGPGKADAFQRGINPNWNGTLPASFFYAADGRLVGYFIGAGTREKFEGAIRQLLDSSPSAGSPARKPFS
jgi:thiol-disulfide isomerase/thioredoxin